MRRKVVFAVELGTWQANRPYRLFVAKHTVALSGNVRSLTDPALKTWKTRAGAQRWLDARLVSNATIVEIP